ncbi:MAG TPA: PKD domain-containing protein [Mucilaginibacter sp.]|nr:PKD domain-containing protein [Mucilaginibacter sp.]
MQNVYSILTRRIKGIDVNVWISMLIIILISGIILVFKIATNVECKHFDIATMDISGSTKNSLFVNEEVTFVAKTSEKTTWDFGDGATADGNKVKHRFAVDGDHVVNVVGNGQCPQLITLKINKKVVPEDDLPDENPIIGPPTALVGKEAVFVYVGKKKPTAFEWSVQNSTFNPVEHGNSVAYKFRIAGKQTVQLRLNNSTKIYTKDIDIKMPAIVSPPPIVGNRRHPTANQNQGSQGGQAKNPDTPARQTYIAPKHEAEAQIPGITDEEFKQMFDAVAEHRNNGQNLKNYLCYGMGTYVKANDKDSESVESICDKLYKGKFKISNVKSVRDNRNCVTRFNISYKKKGWGLFR